MAETGRRATLLAVRHGRTALNASGRFRGLEDVPLDDVGLAEVERTAEAVVARVDPERPVVEIRTSPLHRALSTAEAFGRRFGLEPVVDERLIDLDHGAWTAHRPEEAAALDPEAYRVFRQDPFHAQPPGGEPLADVACRMVQLRDEVAGRSDEPVTTVFVSHEIPLRLLIGPWVEATDHTMWDFPLPTASVTPLACTWVDLRELYCSVSDTGWKP